MEVRAWVINEADNTIVTEKAAADVAGDGSWKLVIKGVPAGGPYMIRTELYKHRDNYSVFGDIIHHLGIGDVYVIAGQSNSSGYGQGVANDAPEIGVSVYRNNNKWDLASHPLNDPTGISNRTNLDWGHTSYSPWLSFAKLLKRELKYPIGLIQASLGGSPLSHWNPDQEGTLYKNMMNIIKSTGSGLTGVLWYQGCSDTDMPSATTYFERFKNMVERFRKDTGSNAWFITVQLNRVIAVMPDDTPWSIVKDAQRRSALEIPRVLLLPSFDANVSDEIHNDANSNIMLGERAAKIVLNKVYGKGTQYCSAIARNAYKTDKGLRIVFNDAANGLKLFGTIHNMTYEISDELGDVKALDCVISGNVMEIITERALASEAYVSMAHGSNPKPLMPVDVMTRIPAVAFYKLKIN